VSISRILGPAGWLGVICTLTPDVSPRNSIAPAAHLAVALLVALILRGPRTGRKRSRGGKPEDHRHNQFLHLHFLGKFRTPCHPLAGVLFIYALWWMPEQSIALPWSKPRLALCSSEPCPRNRTTPDYFNHRALGIRPRPPLWLARVAGLLTSATTDGPHGA